MANVPGMGILSYRDYQAIGVGSSDVARLMRHGTVVRVRRGAYRPGGPLKPEDEYRALIEATWPLLGTGAVLSHASAGVLHGLPIPYRLFSRVHVTRDRPGGGHIGRYLHEHPIRLPTNHVTLEAGRPVTTLARTVVDLARCLPFDWAVAVVDHALRAGLDQDEIGVVLAEGGRAHGNANARAALAFGDPRAESPGESRSRAIFSQHALPIPELQHEVFRGDLLIGRSDFAWKHARVLGEFDGTAKYGALVRPGETAREALVREMRREDALRGEGWLVLRWVWAELEPPDALVERVRHILALGTRAQFGPSPAPGSRMLG